MTITLPDRIGMRMVETMANNMNVVTRLTIEVISEAGKPKTKKSTFLVWLISKVTSIDSKPGT